MFDLLKYKDNTAVITDRGESLTYSKLQKEVDEFYAHIPSKGFLFLGKTRSKPWKKVQKSVKKV